MDEQRERERQLEVQLNVLRERLKSEQADRLELWPKAELADAFIQLTKRARDSLQTHRKNLVGVELRRVDLLLGDVARVMRLVDDVEEKMLYQNQPCFACGATLGAMESPGPSGGRYRRCNSCGYAG
jgi:hypothetical protein